MIDRSKELKNKWCHIPSEGVEAETLSPQDSSVFKILDIISLASEAGCLVTLCVLSGRLPQSMKFVADSENGSIYKIGFRTLEYLLKGSSSDLNNLIRSKYINEQGEQNG